MVDNGEKAKKQILTILFQIKNIEAPYIQKLEHEDSNIIDQMQSSFAQFANKSARGLLQKTLIEVLMMKNQKQNF